MQQCVRPGSSLFSNRSIKLANFFQVLQFNASCTVLIVLTYIYNFFSNCAFIGFGQLLTYKIQSLTYLFLLKIDYNPTLAYLK
jgi:hypothetical protein